MSQFAWQNLFAVAMGGALGSVARFIVAATVHAAIPAFKPAGTMAVNLIGCLMIGGLMQIMTKAETVGTPVYFLLITGVLGGFTTFSAFGYETVVLWQEKQPGWMLINIGGNLICGLLAVFLGQKLAEWCWR